MTTRSRPLPNRAVTWRTGLFSFGFLQHQNRHGSSWSWLQRVAHELYWRRRRRRDVPSWEGSPRTLPFPRGAAPPVHVRHHVVQHVRQRVLDHGSPAHVAHLRGDEEKEEQKKKVWIENMKIWIHTSKEVSCTLATSSGRGRREALTGWYLRSFGGCLKCGPKLTETLKNKTRGGVWKHELYF